MVAEAGLLGGAYLPNIFECGATGPRGSQGARRDAIQSIHTYTHVYIHIQSVLATAEKGKTIESWQVYDVCVCLWQMYTKLILDPIITTRARKYIHKIRWLKATVSEAHTRNFNLLGRLLIKGLTDEQKGQGSIPCGFDLFFFLWLLLAIVSTFIDKYLYIRLFISKYWSQFWIPVKLWLHSCSSPHLCSRLNS